jgi:Stage II sporulation protein E (SpoIIE)
MSTSTQPLIPAKLRDFHERIPFRSLQRKDLVSNGPKWLPLVLALAAIGGVAYVDHLVVSLSLVYLYTLPLTVGAIFLGKEISYGLIVACVLFHYFFNYFDSPRHIHLGLRIFHDLSALLRSSTGMLRRLNSSGPPIGLSPKEICELASADCMPGDVIVFYTDGVTEAGNRFGEEFGLERLSAVVQRGSPLSAEDLMIDIYNDAADFCGDDFNDDVTILVVKCDFGSSSTPSS